MGTSGNKEKSGENTKNSSSTTKPSSDKTNSVSSSRSVESVSVNSGNKTNNTTTNSHNTFKVRKDTSYYSGGAPITTDIPIFREEFLEHNKVYFSIININEFPVNECSFTQVFDYYDMNFLG